MVIACYLMIILSCLMLPSCLKQSFGQQKNEMIVPLNNDVLDQNIVFIAQQEAMLIDIPIPIYDERFIPSKIVLSDSDTMTFGYKSPLSYEQAVDFFVNQMERYGWQQLVIFKNDETILQFQSPDRYCTVLVKDSDHRPLGTSIFIYVKKASTDSARL